MRNSEHHRYLFHEIAYLLGRDLKKIPLLVCCFIVIGLLDILGIALIVPFVSLVVSPEAFSEGQLHLYSSMLNLTGSNRSVLISGGVLIVVFLLKALVGISIQWLIVRFSNERMVAIRGDLMHSYQELPYDIYTQRNSSEYIFAMQSLTSIFAGRVLLPCLKILSDGIVCLAILVFLAFNIGSVLLYLVASIVPLMFVFDWIFKAKLTKYGANKNDAATIMLNRLNEGVSGLKEIRMVNAESFFFEELMTHAKEFSVNESRTQTINVAPRYIIEFMIVTFLIVLVSLSQLDGGVGDGVVPTLAMLSFGAVRLLPCMNSILTNTLALRANRDAVSRLYNDVVEVNTFEEKKPTSGRVALSTGPFDSIELLNVWYRYPGASSPVLRGVDVLIQKGQSIGIIGPSGAGKSTLVDLLLGLLAPDSGQIFYNGVAGEDLRSQLSQLVAYLPQETFLADASLLENVALGLKRDKIDAARVQNCLDLAQLSRMVEELPHGLNTQIGERGARLSGGQRQRIALARAFYHKRAILVLDEATSALDEETEAEILHEIELLKGQNTIIMISHRPSTLAHCDTILHMEGGKVIQQGSFEEVIGTRVEE